MKGNIKKCPECGSNKLFWDRNRAEVNCKNCGFVLEDKLIDFSQEWREFDTEQGASKRRVGSPLTFTKHDKGLSTKIGKAGDLMKMTPSERRMYYRIMRWHIRVSTPTERNLKFSLSELKRISSFLNVPKIVEEDAAMIYRNAAEKGLVRGRSMESVVAGAIYAACRRHGVPRTLDEISGAFPLDKKEIGKTYRFICRELRIRILPTSPLDYIHRFASELKLTPKTVSKAIDIMNEANKKEITSGKGPMGIAAASLYVAALLVGEKKTQREVADVAGVTEVTIRNRYKELLEKLKLEDEIKKLRDKEGI
ncbi:MAG TPA: transcription initiation factor IIB [Candidatus Woesearchaeota archaeon]|nr:transcription initiation factor IIB [Candidatus Woesearchaeota archaeon]